MSICIKWLGEVFNYWTKWAGRDRAVDFVNNAKSFSEAKQIKRRLSGYAPRAVSCRQESRENGGQCGNVKMCEKWQRANVFNNAGKFAQAAQRRRHKSQHQTAWCRPGHADKYVQYICMCADTYIDRYIAVNRRWATVNARLTLRSLARLQADFQIRCKISRNLNLKYKNSLCGSYAILSSKR